jgi:hypothetical protein
MERFAIRRGLISLGLGMTPPHHVRVKALFQHFSRAGFDHSLAPHQCGPMGLVVQIRLDAVGLLLREEARFRVGMGHVQPATTGQYVFD